MNAWHYVAAAATPIATAFMYRLRGSSLFKKWTGQGDTVARLTWGAVCGASAWLDGAPWWLALSLVLPFGLAASVGNFDAIDMGRRDGTELGDFVWLTIRGAILVAPAALVAAVLSQAVAGDPYRWVCLVIAGLLISPVYALSWAIDPRQENLGFWGGPVEKAEFAFGLVAGAGISFSIVV